MLKKITKRTVDEAEPGAKDAFIWDIETKGFGLKVTPAGQKVFIFQYRWPGKRSPERVTIARLGELTAEQARDEAEIYRGDLRRGIRPSLRKQRMAEEERAGITVSQLCDQYLKEGCAAKKKSTLDTDKGRIERHIKPLLGKLLVRSVTSADIKRFVTDVANGKTATTEKTRKRGVARVTGGKGTAARTTGLLGAIFTFATESKIRSDNPVRGVSRPADRKLLRFLSAEELARLGKALDEEREAGLNPVALDAVRFLALSGCRRGEALGLRWDEVDFANACLRLGDSKTGEKTVPLGAPALQLLSAQTRIEDCPFVFAGRGNGHLVGLPRIWERVRKAASLEDVRLHDLRHSFASVAAGTGLGLPIVGALLGHRDTKTTSRYVHFGKDPLKDATNRIAGRIAQGMAPKKRRARSANVVPIRPSAA